MSKIKIFALGGQNERGKNMYVVSVDKKIFVFDAGLKYPDDVVFGIDYIIPNYDYLKDNKDDIVGIFITHGHNEQIGAICDILQDIPDIKIYGGKLTLEIIKNDMKESGITKANLIEIKPHKKINFGDLSIFPIQVSHSIPDSFMYVLNTHDGSIVFSGNYFFDPSMQGHYSMDVGKLAYIGKQNVLCLMNESIYADKEGFVSPKHKTEEFIRNILSENKGRIFFNIFDSQIYRLQDLLDQLTNNNKSIVIMGKYLENIVLKGIELGYINFDKDRIKTISHVNDPGIIVIISDEREKPYSSLKRIVRNGDKFVQFNDKDTVVMLSPVYDANEKSATDIFNKIAKIGCNLITLPKTYMDAHAASQDLMLMINLMKPKYYFPIMGDYRLQVLNGNLAKKMGYSDENILLKLNGEVVSFENGKLKDSKEIIKIDTVLIDGKTQGDIGDLVLKDREMLSDSGIVIVNCNISRETREIINKPNIVTKGFIYVKENIDLLVESENIVRNIIENYVTDNYIDYNKIKIEIRNRLGRYFYNETESKPMIIVVIQEI